MMRIFGLIIKSSRKYTEAIANLINQTAFQLLAQYNKGLNIGYQSGYRAKETETQNQGYIDHYRQHTPVRQAYEILWEKEREGGEL